MNPADSSYDFGTIATMIVSVFIVPPLVRKGFTLTPDQVALTTAVVTTVLTAGVHYFETRFKVKRALRLVGVPVLATK